MVIPVIENIHQKVLEAVSGEGKLQMNSWHESEETNEEGAYCGTTHCRAGWVVTIAGKPGRDLELKTSTLFAAQQIYHKSSPNIPVVHTKFFQSNEIAMEDIKRCAEEEKSK